MLLNMLSYTLFKNSINSTSVTKMKCLSFLFNRHKYKHQEGCLMTLWYAMCTSHWYSVLPKSGNGFA